MSKRRMFSTHLIYQNDFYDLPNEAKVLYFYLNMEADDEGFVEPKRVIKSLGIPDDNIKILAAKQMVIPFRSGVVVITHWRQNNFLRKDRFTETLYKEERSLLSIGKTKIYEYGQPLVNQMSTVGQPNLTKLNLTKLNNKDSLYVSQNTVADAPHSQKIFKAPSEDEIIEYGQMYFRDEFTIEEGLAFYDHFKSNGWRVGGKAPMKDWKSALNNWHRRDIQFRKGGKK